MSVMSALIGAKPTARYLAASVSKILLLRLQGQDGVSCMDAAVRAAAIVLISGAKPGRAADALRNAATLLHIIADHPDIDVPDEEVLARGDQGAPEGVVLQ